MATIVRNEDHFDYAIVGGCFGASTALALIREWPDARIVWFEGTHTYTASQDKSKIIRADYVLTYFGQNIISSISQLGVDVLTHFGHNIVSSIP